MPRILLFYCFVCALFLTACVADGPGEHPAKKHKHSVYAEAAPHPSKTYNLNVFIDNSISMNGYVNQVTSFQDAIYAIVTDMQLSGQISAVNFYFINNTPIIGKLDASLNDAQHFLNGLSPAVFSKNGKALGSSDLKTNLEQALRKVDRKSASIFISDCIFSPGNKVNAAKFLRNQETGLKTSFKQKLDSIAFITKILKYEAGFNGKYFDQDDLPEPISSKTRPFYMIAMGPPELLAGLWNSQNLELYRGRGFKDQLTLSSPGNEKVPAKLIYKYRSGLFSIHPPASRLIIDNATLADDKPFRFAVAADLHKLSDLPKDLKAGTAVEITPGFKMDSVMPVQDTSEKSLKGMTHIFLFSAEKLKDRQDITFTLFRRTPAWVAQTSTDNDRGLIASGQLDRTFGLAYLVDGIKDAYEMAYKDPKLIQLQMQINTTENSDNANASQFNWPLLILFAVGLAIFIIIKSKK